MQRPELNGRRGVVAGAINSGRCPVLLDGESKPLSLRAACLVPLQTPAEEPPLMCCVRRGLMEGACPDGSMSIPAGTPFVALPAAVFEWGLDSAELQSLLTLLLDTGTPSTLASRGRLHALDGLRVLLDGDTVATVCGYDAASKNLDIVLDSDLAVVCRVKPARLARQVEIPAAVQSKKKLCLACGAAADGEITLKKCGGCVEAKVAEPAYFCGEACQRLAWPTHKKEHKQQRSQRSFQRMLSSVDARSDEDELAEAAGQPSGLGDCKRAHQSQDWRALAKAARKLINQDPGGYFGYAMLTHALVASSDVAGAAEASMLSLERLIHEEPDETLLASTQVDTIGLLMHGQSEDMQKPPWWNDAELLDISENALAVALRNRGRREQMSAWRVRGLVLCGLLAGGPALPPALPRLAYLARLREAKVSFQNTITIATDSGISLAAIEEELKPFQDAVAARLAELETP